MQEDVFNRAYVLECAGVVKKYCDSHRYCEDCLFHNVRVCQLNMHPTNWDLKRVDYGINKDN